MEPDDPRERIAEHTADRRQRTETGKPVRIQKALSLRRISHRKIMPDSETLQNA